MQNKSKNHKIDKVDEIVSILSQIESQAITDSLADYYETQQMIEAVDFATIIDNPSLNNLTYYCTKTGQPISKLAPDSFIKMQETVGVALAEDIFKRKSIEQVSSHWLCTTDKALDKLSNIDPYGYFIYSVFLIIRCSAISKYYTHSKQSRENNEREARWEELTHKIKLWNIIQSIAIKDILELNELMRRYLALIQNSTLPSTIKVT